MTKTAMVVAVGAFLCFIRVFGFLGLVTFLILLIANIARLVLGAYQAFNIMMDFALGASILVLLMVQDYLSRLSWPR